MGLFNRRELERIAELEKMVNDLKGELEIHQGMNKEIGYKKHELNQLTEDIEYKRALLSSRESRLENLSKEVEEKANLLNSINNEIKESEERYQEHLKESENIVVVVESGTYEYRYHYEDSSKYEEKLKDIKEKQKYMVQYGNAVEHFVNWCISGSYKKGEIQMRNTDKLLLRAFNNECDNIIMNVKYSSISSCESKIRKSYEQLNKFVKSHQCAITEEYLNLKLEELELRCGYITMKQREKEEQQRIKEQMREEERVRKEIEAEEKKVEKEEQHFMNEINKLQKRMAKENQEAQAILLKQIEELQSKLAEVSEVKADLMNRRLNNKAGYVYVISNVGSFGENVYKIGTTRRLDPQVRVDELSNASVPFKYDVHAMIFSDDAFELEYNLHQIFDKNRVNKVNKHKEFFNVSIDEIEKAVKENFNETVEFNKTILNEEYLLTLSMK